MIGLVLALIVVAIVFSLLGLWFAGIPLAAIAIIVFVLFLTGWGRRAKTDQP